MQPSMFHAIPIPRRNATSLLCNKSMRHTLEGVIFVTQVSNLILQSLNNRVSHTSSTRGEKHCKLISAFSMKGV